MQSKVVLEFQHFHGCPNGPKLLNNIKEAIKGLDDVELNERIIDSNEKAKKYNFRGSPTLLINGEDFEELAAPKLPSLTCRFYPNGIPGSEDIKKKISGYMK